MAVVAVKPCLDVLVRTEYVSSKKHLRYKLECLPDNSGGMVPVYLQPLASGNANRRSGSMP
jgi:hypothetical protein